MQVHGWSEHHMQSGLKAHRSVTTFAKPKSASRMKPSASSRMFSGFRSLHMRTAFSWYCTWSNIAGHPRISSSIDMQHPPLAGSHRLWSRLFPYKGRSQRGRDSWHEVGGSACR
jgi:hypothetical protein